MCCFCLGASSEGDSGLRHVQVMERVRVRLRALLPGLVGGAVLETYLITDAECAPEVGRTDHEYGAEWLNRLWSTVGCVTTSFACTSEVEIKPFCR